jgi:hypothetical protein
MWDCGDIDSKTVLQAWRQPRPAVVLSAVAKHAAEHHWWHVAASSNAFLSSGSNVGTAYTAPDVHLMSGFYALTMPLLPDGAVSTAIADGLMSAAALMKSARSS